MRVRTAVRGLLILFVAGVVAIVAILLSVDLEDFRGIAEGRAKAALGRELVIAGPMSLSIGLRPTITAEDVRLANAEGGSRPHLATIGRIEAELELLPLLGGVFNLTRLVIADADVLLESDAGGQPNWAFPLGDTTTEASSTARPPFLANLAIIDSRLVYRPVEGDPWQVDVDAAGLSAESLSSPVAVAVNGTVRGVPVSIDGRVGSLLALLQGEGEWPVDVTGTVAGSPLRLDGTVGDLRSLSDYDLAIQADLTDTHWLATVLSPDLAALPPLSLDVRVKAAGETLTLQPFSVTVADASVSGDLTVDLGADRPRLAGTLAADRFDPTVFQAAAPEVEDTRLIPATPLPFAALGLFDADLGLSVDSLVVGQEALENVVVDAQLADRVLTATVVEATAMDGTLTMTVRADGTVSPGALSVEAVVRNLDLARVSDDQVRARLDAHVNLAGQGDTLRSVVLAGTGHAGFTVGRATIANQYLDLVGRNVLTALLPGSTGPVSTLNCAVGRFDIARGQARSRALLADLPMATVAGEGVVDLDSEQMDFLLRPESKDPDLFALDAAVRVYGPIADPQVAPDIESAIRQGATTLLLGAINPIGLLVPFVSPGTGSENPCIVALENPRPSSTMESVGQAADEAAGEADRVLRGTGQAIGETLDSIGEGIDDTFNSLFGN